MPRANIKDKNTEKQNPCAQARKREGRKVVIKKRKKNKERICKREKNTVKTLKSKIKTGIQLRKLLLGFSEKNCTVGLSALEQKEFYRASFLGLTKKALARGQDPLLNKNLKAFGLKKMLNNVGQELPEQTLGESATTRGDVEPRSPRL